jgi:hypothetical protein
MGGFGDALRPGQAAGARHRGARQRGAGRAAARTHARSHAAHGEPGPPYAPRDFAATGRHAAGIATNAATRQRASSLGAAALSEP